MQKNDSKKREKKSIVKNTKTIGYYLPIMFIILIIPLITFGKIVELPIEEANFWKGGTTHVDFFSYYKSIALVFGTIALVIAYGGLYLEKRLPLKKEKRYYIPMLIYSLFVIISTIMSQNKNVALQGFIEIYQGMSILLCYVIILYVVMNYIQTERDIKIIIYSFSVLAFIIGILGLSQYFGFDFLRTSIGKFLITPKSLRDANINFTFGKYTIYATFYNTNFVGSFGALMLPLMTILYLFSKEKKRTTIFFILSLLSFSTWLGSNSRAGYFGIMIAFVLAVIIFRKIIKNDYKKVLYLSAGFLSITIIFNLASGGRVLSQFYRLNPLTEAKKLENIRQEQKVDFKEISVKEDTFTVKTGKETLILTVKDNKIIFTDENNKILVTIKDSDEKIQFTDEKYRNYNFLYLEEQQRIKAELYDRPLNLYVLEDDTIKVISMNNKLTEPMEAPRNKIFDGRETFASNRGYIWSRTMPMMKDTLIIGYGPDNYCLKFPQEDYIGRFNTGRGMTNIVVDKPHNMYMQTAINTGMVSLLALLSLWIIYFFDSLKKYINGNIKTFNEYMGAACFLSVVAYLLAGIFNDNIISVTPLFWVVLGLGIGINGIDKYNAK